MMAHMVCGSLFRTLLIVVVVALRLATVSKDESSE
jgi:hypothetical protein